MAKRSHKYDTETSGTSTALPGEDSRLALERMTNRAQFQDLCDRVLSAHFGYDLQPRGVNARGTVVGQPDSLGRDKDGRLCAIAHGTDRRWRDKLRKDLDDVAVVLTPGQPNLEVFVFCTNRHVDATVEREEKAAVLRDHGWELRVYGQNDLAVPLDTELQDLRLKYLGIAVERHNWPSLLDACALQRRSALARYREEREPSVYVPRSLEDEVGRWYEEARRAIATGGTSKQLFPVVDQSGAGKSTLMLHLCERYGAGGPVLLIPGSIAISDDHALEREICTAVGYPLHNRVFQADLRGLCRLAAREGTPFLVVIDALDNTTAPDRLRGALT